MKKEKFIMNNIKLAKELMMLAKMLEANEGDNDVSNEIEEKQDVNKDIKTIIKNKSDLSKLKNKKIKTLLEKEDLSGQLNTKTVGDLVEMLEKIVDEN